MNRPFNFGEWLPWEQNASPMLLTLTLNAGMKDLREYFGMPLWTTVILFENNQAKWLFRPKELKLLGQKMIDFLSCPQYRVSFFTGYDMAEEAVLKQAEQIQFSTAFSDLDNDQLANLFEDFARIYYRWYKFGWFCEPIQFQAQDMLNSYLEKESANQQGALNPAEAKQALFFLEEDSFTVGILYHLRECAVALSSALRDPQLSNEINDLKSQQNFATAAAEKVLMAGASNDAGDLGPLFQKIKEHRDNFYWKKNNYFSTKFLGEQDVLEELFSADDFDVAGLVPKYDDEIQKLQDTKTTLLKKKRELVDNLPPYLRNLVALVGSVGGTLLDRRKRVIMVVNAAFDKILEEAASRTKTELPNVRQLIPQELSYFLSSPGEYKDRFERRKQLFVVFQGDFSLIQEQIADLQAENEGTAELSFDKILMREPFIAEGDQAELVLEQLNQYLNFLQTTGVTGLDAIHGVSTYFNPSEPTLEGVVRIIKDPKTETLKSDEILVAPSTTPDYMDAIRRCKAIITDWGGQTSHAAITSRELSKPCIIATNYASQVLRNGDRVKIDFTQGVIEKIKG